MNLDKTSSWTANPYKVGIIASLTVALVYVLLFKYSLPDVIESPKSLSLQVLEACIMNDNDTMKCAMIANEVSWVVTPEKHVPVHVPSTDDNVNNINNGPANAGTKLTPSDNCSRSIGSIFPEQIDPQCQVWHSKEDISTEGDLKQWKHPK